MKKSLPVLNSDAEAEQFVEQADLTQYDLSALVPVSFEFKPKQKNVTMRISETLLDEIKQAAQRSGVPYQRFIRQTLEQAIHHK